MVAREALRKRVLFGVDDEIDVALAVQVTFLWRWRAIAVKPMLSNSAPSAFGSGAAYSTNSKPSVPIGLSQGVNFMRVSCNNSAQYSPAAAALNCKQFPHFSVLRNNIASIPNY
jgi:hypothetical protein